MSGLKPMLDHNGHARTYLHLSALEYVGNLGHRAPEDIFGKGVLTFCEAHCTNGWVAEHHCGNSRVVQLGILLALKQSVCQLSACSNGNCPNNNTKCYSQKNQKTSTKPYYYSYKTWVSALIRCDYRGLYRDEA